MLGGELTTDSLKAIMQSVLESVSSLSPTARAGLSPSGFGGHELVLSRALNWNDIAAYPDQQHPRLDGWFSAFETKLKGMKILREAWAEKFMECPKVSSEFKNLLQTTADERNLELDYDNIRKLSFAEHGPLLPLEYHQRLFGQVRGETREDVMEQLKEILLLYNRAAADSGAPLYTHKKLVYYFIDAFPEDVSKRLEQELGAALATGNPLQALQFKAPSRTTLRPIAPPSVNSVATPSNLVASPVCAMDREAPLARPQESVEEIVKKTAEAVAHQIAAITRSPESDGWQSEGNRKRMRQTQSCPGCGGDCSTLQDCPAQGRRCLLCSGPDHYARVCGRRRQGRWTSRKFNAPPFDRPAGRAPPRPWTPPQMRPVDFREAPADRRPS